MADLTGNLAGGPTGTQTAPQRAVQGANVAQQVAGFAQGIGNIFQQKVASDTKQAQFQADQNQTGMVGSFIGGLDNIAQAVEQGSMTTKEARDASSHLLTKINASTNNQIGSELLDVYNKFTSSTLGVVLKEGTENAQLAKKEQVAAAEGGWFFSTSSPEEVERGLENYRATQTLQRQRDLQMKKNAYARDRMETGTAEMDFQVALEEKEANDSLKSYAPLALEKIHTRSNDLITRKNAGEDPKLLLAEARAIRLEVEGTINSQGASSTKDLLARLSSPINALLTEVTGVLDGSIETDNLNKSITLSSTRMKAQLLATGNNAAIKAIGDTFGPDALLVFQKEILDSGTSFLESVIKNKPVPTLIGEDSEQSAEVALATFRAGTKEGATVQEQKMAFDSANTVLKSIDAFQSAAKSPKDFKNLVSVLANPAFIKAMKTGQIDQQAQEKALEVFEAQYSLKVLPAITTGFNAINFGVENSLGLDGKPMKMPAPSEYLEPVVRNDGSVVFKIKGDYGKNNPKRNVAVMGGSGLAGPMLRGGMSDRALQQSRDNANKTIAPAMSRTLQAHAHLSLTEDYGKVFNEFYMDLFTPAEEATVEAQPVAEPAPAPAENLKQPDVGTVVDGYTYTGGDPRSPSSWRLSDAE